MNAPNQLSFLPEDYLENKAQRRANVICAVLFLVTMVSIGVAFTTSEHSLKEVEQKHAKVEQEFTEAAKRIQQVQQLQEKQRMMAHQAELTASLLEKVPRSLILAKITNSLPQGCSLMDFVLVSTPHKSAAAQAPAGKPTFAAKKSGPDIGAAVAEAKVYDVNVKITGLAPTDTQVGDLIKRLKAIPVFKDVNLVVSDWEKTEGTAKDKNTDDQFRKFQIEMILDPNADVQDLTDNTTTTASVGLNK